MYIHRRTWKYECGFIQSEKENALLFSRSGALCLRVSKDKSNQVPPAADSPHHAASHGGAGGQLGGLCSPLCLVGLWALEETGSAQDGCLPSFCGPDPGHGQ